MSNGTFVPRNEDERFAIEEYGEAPAFNIGQCVRFVDFHADKGETVIREVHLRVRDYPFWQFETESFPGRWFTSGDFEAIGENSK